MGHKVHTNGFRLGVSRTWNAKWYSDKEYTDLLKEDLAIRKLVGARLANASVSLVEIERGINHVTVTVHTAKPGIVIGKGGANVESLRQAIGKLTDRKVKLEIREIRQPELDAVLVATNIAQQLTRRIAFRKAIKQSIQRTMKAGAKGVKVMVSGRLGGSEMARREWDKEGAHPARDAARGHQLRPGPLTHDVRAPSAVKVWIYRGDVLPEKTAPAEADSRADGRDGLTMLMPRRVKYRKQAAWPHERHRQGRSTDRLRRLRPHDRRGPATSRADRSRRPLAAHMTRLRPTWRQDLDPRVPRTSRSRRSRPRFAWARARARPTTGVAGRQARRASSSRWPACPMTTPSKRCASPATSCRRA